MRDIVKKTGISSIIIILAIIIFSFATFYYPLRTELRNSYIENFKLLSDANIQAIEYFIDRNMESTDSLSSRTMIRNKIGEYKTGSVSIEELSEYTGPRYLDGVRVLKDVLASYRVVEEQVIAEYNIEEVEEIVFPEGPSRQINIIIREDGEIIVRAISPIIQEQEAEVQVLGYDVTYFNMGTHIDELITEDIQIEVVAQETRNEILGKAEVIEATDQLKLLESKEEIGYLYEVGETEKYLFLYISTETLFRPLRRITAISYGAFVIGLIGLFAVINYIVLRNSKKIVEVVEKSRDQYKHQAYRDSLTGVYTRLFLNNWMDNNFEGLDMRENKYSLAMIDVDDFKKINDQYGHSTGDQVLIKIAGTIKASVRDRDITIRFGGDEFLIIFKNCDPKTAKVILKRIEKKLKTNGEFGFPVSISYGIAEIRDKEDFSRSLNEADRCMYDCKDNKKNNNNK